MPWVLVGCFGDLGLRPTAGGIAGRDGCDCARCGARCAAEEREKGRFGDPAPTGVFCKNRLEPLHFRTDRLDYGEETYLDALSDLVAAYEDEHHAIAPASDADMLRHLMETRDVAQAQVHRETGIAKSTLSEILAGRKPFSRRTIRKLADYFQVDVRVLAGNL